MSFDYPSNYLTLNALSSKQLQVVVQIEGIDFLFSTNSNFANLSAGTSGVSYGSPGVHYGDTGIFYGGLTGISGVKPYLSLDGSMTIGQKIEPEQGRGSVTLLTLSLIDKDGYMSEVISPGVLIDEPLGGKEVKVYVGYQGTAFPEDFFVALRGFISSTVWFPGKVSIQLSDPNMKRRAQNFFTPTTTLSTNINSSTTTIPVVNSADFYDQIQGPDSTYDSHVHTYIQIDDEIMEYAHGARTDTSITVTRAARGTVAASHASAADVSNAIQIDGNVIDIALKIMLSGWNGPWLTGITISSIVDTGDITVGSIANSITLDPEKDAVLDYGLNGGEYVTITGSTAGNNGTYIVSSFQTANGTSNNVIIVTGGTLNNESPATAVQLSFRSQYDTLPIAAGLKMRQADVDIARHVTLRNSYLSTAEYNMRFYITEAESGKTFIESELFLPIGAYSITRFGRCSMALTIPPIADQKLTILDKTNILDIQNMSVTRATNNRRFFNEIDYYFDADDQGNFNTQTRFLDDTSLTKFDTSSVLPIKSKGLRTDLSAPILITRRGTFLLNRYKNCAIEIKFKTTWAMASTIEVGDVVALQDNGDLFIINFSNGTTNSNTQLYEVIDRSLDIKGGNGSLTLLGSIGVEATDRFATISPSSKVDTGSTTTSIRIKDSFGAIFPGNESKKWQDAIGLPIFVHSADYSVVSSEVTLTGIDPTDHYKLNVTPALGFTPSADQIVEIAKYPTSTDPSVQAFYKLVYAHVDPTTTVVTGTSSTQFTVSSGDAANMVVGNLIYIHNTNYSVQSPEVTVTNITGTTITVGSSLGFTPSAGQKIELVGFQDKGAAYRII